ncbi:MULTISPECIES: GGDEF domain-containing protein [Prauserella salsuginis group]|uniref:GGDEF domain-containing protein n=1 Tax=Prauserella salsuginis TaxID=387889 RepID=A0ABW6G8G2_9PSEU|nr:MULTISPECIES: EAL domain-containing protein [Prauserella salsuginis group]MCR3721860.1 diguanylate cyclase (GGDEF) domain-containing protein [Prauserella flava]MCR3734551.1 diguanylate cyclase (GGDEF) domain-containing protein [Prauserella salsuginis]
MPPDSDGQESVLNQVQFAFQPLYSLHTGSAVAVEALARPAAGRISELLESAMRLGRLVQADTGLAARAIHEAEHQAMRLPLHLNITALTAASPSSSLEPLLTALQETGRRPHEVVFEVGPPFHTAPPAALLDGLNRLTAHGFRLAFDGLGAADLPLNLLAESQTDMVKLDRSSLRRLPDDTPTAALTEALVHFADRTGVRLVATGIESEDQLDMVRGLGIGLVQGNLFAPAGPGSVPAGAIAPAHQGRDVYPSGGTPAIKDFLRPARTVAADATCDEVRTVLVDDVALSGLVGVDADGRPRWSIDRTRFLLAVTGPFGHALHAHRPAQRLADPPHVIRNSASALEVLDLVSDSPSGRASDDVVVIDESGRCQGVVLMHELVRGMAEAKVEQAAALNPLTRLPGSDAVARDVDRRLAANESLVVGWLDIDSFKTINDTAGFAAGDDVIRAIGRALTRLATDLGGVTVSHVGGDDFLISCGPDTIRPLADAMLDTHWSADGMPVTVSLSTLWCLRRSVESYGEISRLLAPLKKHAKNLAGSSWVCGKPGTDHVEVLRGTPGGSGASASAV